MEQDSHSASNTSPVSNAEHDLESEEFWTLSGKKPFFDIILTKSHINPRYLLVIENVLTSSILFHLFFIRINLHTYRLCFFYGIVLFEIEIDASGPWLTTEVMPAARNLMVLGKTLWTTTTWRLVMRVSLNSMKAAVKNSFLEFKFSEATSHLNCVRRLLVRVRILPSLLNSMCLLSP